MKISHFCYTRGKNLDYTDFAYPAGVHRNILNDARDMAMTILGDRVKRNLSVPKWILLKDREYVVWGVCCYNEVLSPGRGKDITGTLVRGFFGLIMTDIGKARLKVPYDLSYFRRLYSLEVESHWGQREPHECSTAAYVDTACRFVESSSNDYVGRLNTDFFCCRSLGELDREKAIAAALSLDKVSLVIDNDNVDQATARGMAFMNCISSNVKEGVFPVTRKCPNCGKYVTSFTPNGVCRDCAVQVQKPADQPDGRHENEIERLKRELRLANQEIERLNLQIESGKKTRKIIAVAVAAILLLILLFSYGTEALLDILQQ